MVNIRKGGVSIYLLTIVAGGLLTNHKKNESSAKSSTGWNRSLCCHSDAAAIANGQHHDEMQAQMRQERQEMRQERQEM
jgi:hypothetical protein